MIKETRTDYLGAYTAYIYPDGHVETDPPNRPTSQEDAQRARRRQLAQTLARRMLEIERTKYGLASSTPPPEVVRQKAGTLTGRLVAEEYHRTAAVFGELPETIGVPAGLSQTLLTTVEIGGEVEGSSQEFLARTPQARPETGVRPPTFPTEVNDGQ